MKKILTLLIVGLLSLNSIAQSSVVESAIKSVKVYTQNAEITREINTKLIAGQQEIVLSDISLYIDPSSLQVQIENSKNVQLLSAKYERDYLTDKKEIPEIVKLKEELENTMIEIAWEKEQKTILVGMEDILNKNKVLGGDSGFTPAQVIELTNVYKVKLLEIRKELNKITLKEKKLNIKRNKLQNQLNELQASFNRPSGNIVLIVSAKNPTTVNLKCTYIVSNAGWTPMYDLRSAGITENVKLNYKANVYQNTGQEWKAVKMIVSTGNPSLSNDRPILNPLYASISPEPELGIVSARFYPTVEDEEEVVASPQKIEKKEKVAYEDAYKYNTQVSQNQINVEYVINQKQDIASDGKVNMLGLIDYELDTQYVYHSVPKLDESAFLLAKISNWGQYNLVSGEANLFFEGAYVGKSFINSAVTADELLLSMGRDNSIVIERKAIKEYTSSKFIGSKKKEQFGYEIIVKNKKSIPIEIEILDQIPISQDKKIEIILDENGSANHTKEEGKLLWKLKIEAGQSKKERFVYTVKYPKKGIVSGLR